MFFWGGCVIAIMLFFSCGPRANWTHKTRGRSGRKKNFCGKTSGHGALLDCRGFLKNFAFFTKNFDFREGLGRKRMVFRYFPRLSGPTDGAGGIFPENHQKNTKKTSKTIIFYVFELFFIVFLMLFLVSFHVFSCCFPCFFDVF